VTSFKTHGVSRLAFCHKSGILGKVRLIAGLESLQTGHGAPDEVYVPVAQGAIFDPGPPRGLALCQ
jgi:hypothetical protein